MVRIPSSHWPASTPLRVVTFNTGKCDGPYAQRLPAMAHALRALNPDVVALQESFATVDGQVNTAQSLALALGLHCQQAPARTKKRVFEGQTVNSHSGLALLSRWPIAQHAVLALPCASQDGERVALLCRIAVPGHLLTVANVHLTHLQPHQFPGTTELRRSQMQVVQAHPWLHIPGGAALLCGDFNAPLAAPELREFVTPTGVWVDAARACGLGDKVTCPGGPLGSQDLDHVLSHAASPLHWHAPSLVLDHPDAAIGVRPSDHQAVCLDGHLLP